MDAHPERMVSLFCEDGIIALVDASAYQPFIGDWTYETLVARFEEQMAKLRIFVWEPGDGGSLYQILVRQGFTAEAGVRSVQGAIEVTAATLHFASYTALTMAAQFDDSAIPDHHEGDAVIAMAPGRYRIRLVQLFAPDNYEFPDDQPKFLLEFEEGDGPQLSGPAWLRS